MWSERRLAGAMAVSLLLNLFLVGLIVGHVFTGAPRPPSAGAPPAGLPPAGAGPLVRPGTVKLLTPDERKSFNTAMARHRPAIRLAREAVRARRQAVDSALAAPTLEDAAPAMAALREAGTELAEANHAALLDALAALPSPARASLVTPERGPVEGR